MSALGGFTTRALIEQWLKAGVVDRGRFAPTEEGTPQGGVISPVLMNVALHGLENSPPGPGTSPTTARTPANRFRKLLWW
jgi:hypothetical protein